MRPDNTTTKASAKMANVKQVECGGLLPFNCHECEALQPFLAQTNSPTINLKINWADQPAKMVPSGTGGGQTALYAFYLHGREAVSWAWIDAFKAAVVAAGGSITGGVSHDVEAA